MTPAESLMAAFRIIILVVLLAICGPQRMALAADVSSCLTKEHRQAVQAGGRVVPLASAKRAVPAHKGEMVRAKLCQQPNGLVYLLTLLARDGKVTHVAVDASSGRLAGGR
jgi:uncharacterized membrane protein YkoI